MKSGVFVSAFINIERFCRSVLKLLMAEWVWVSQNSEGNFADNVQVVD